MDIVRRSLANSGSCAYFVFPLTELPFSDLGPRIAHYAAQLEPTILLSLVLVCKKFHRWCAPILYQSIHLSKGANIGLFSRTISSNPSLAQHVRRILVEGDPIFFFPDFKICGNLCALALFFFCWDTQGRKLDLPPSVVHLACDPQHFIALPPPSPSLETTFQAITHLHLLTKLPTIQFWKWLGRVHAPILSHLAVEHHSNESLRNNSRELMACLTEYLPTQIRLCVLLVISGDTLSNPLDLNSIDLSDGTVDNRVVLGAAFPREPVYKLGYLLNLDLFAIRKTWMSSSLWDEAERVQLERAISGKFPPVVRF
ncbi:hypothetical protein DL96DRAFT_1616773 [Flagelloscypha sp. PMI_526]|nr:hypothetical protein DL96DRAFT_1616773 [Flagelloscypha sp. PMI_526]